MKRIPPDGATARSRVLRTNMTDTERKVWTLLRSAFPEWRFRRQVPFRQYIADFASHRARLVIEIDGGQHNEFVDASRTAIIEADGYRVLRFWNNDVLKNIEGVAIQLATVLDETSPPPNPPPSRGRASLTESS
ncbi:MAG TPA: endonuclease domain-containing protein [Sphingopyxis sp.]|nr:endonuclease domain-containing protein [Sphingopyxis sp.]HMP46861.1 endonuclease domain-containing protein [Sphingopyxis sp.]HMQ19437.1 endonuclease domain-containing protein [Sphingopyxis sp.]